MKSKLQYLGCVPLPSEEKFVNNIQQAVSDKHDAFLNLYNAQIIANESSILKEQCEKELKNLAQALNANNRDSETGQILTDYQDRKTLEFNVCAFFCRKIIFYLNIFIIYFVCF